MQHRRVIAIFAGVLLPITVSVCRASAAEDNGRADNVGWTDGAGVGALASQPTPSPEQAGHAGGGRPQCTYQPLDADHAAAADGMAADGWGPAKTAGPGAWYQKICTDAVGMTSGVTVWVPTASTDP